MTFNVTYFLLAKGYIWNINSYEWKTDRALDHQLLYLALRTSNLEKTATTLLLVANSVFLA